MNAINIILLVFGLGTCARGIYSVVVQDVEEDAERLVGRAATRHGLILIVIGLACVSHAIFEWPWVNALVDWLRRHE
jgi:hypothetical protein